MSTGVNERWCKWALGCMNYGYANQSCLCGTQHSCCIVPLCDTTKRWHVIIIIVLLLFVEEVVVVGQTFRSISSHAGLQLPECFFFWVTLPLRCLLVHSTMRQTTKSVKWRSVDDTAVVDFLNWDARFTRDSNPGLQHDLHAPQARTLPLTPPWRWCKWYFASVWHNTIAQLWHCVGRLCRARLSGGYWRTLTYPAICTDTTTLKAPSKFYARTRQRRALITSWTADV